jgi:sugar phosphate permease
MQQVLGYSPIHAGLSYLPLALVIMASAGIASQLVTTIGYKPVLAAGMLMIVTGLLWFSRVSVDGSFTSDILGPSLFAAAGLGFSFVTTTIAAVSGVDENEAGLASGLINTSQQIGGAIGLAVLSSIATSYTADITDLNDLTDGFQAAFLGGAAIAFLGFILTLILIRNSDSRDHVELGKKEAAEAASA